MSWTWAGFWRDDPVFRFNAIDFFQSGRHKAEERFWDKQIHGTGGYIRRTRTLPPRWSRQELYELKEEDEKKKQDNQDEDQESGTDEEMEKEMEKKREEVRRWEERRRKHRERKLRKGAMTWQERQASADKKEFGGQTETDEVMSNLTCLSCSKCSQPIATPERWSSRDEAIFRTEISVAEKYRVGQNI